MGRSNRDNLSHTEITWGTDKGNSGDIGGHRDPGRREPSEERLPWRMKAAFIAPETTGTQPGNAKTARYEGPAAGR
jgi:hypothetical protein